MKSNTTKLNDSIADVESKQTIRKRRVIRSTNTSIYIDFETLEELEQYTYDNRKSRSLAITYLIKQSLKNHKKGSN